MLETSCTLQPSRGIGAAKAVPQGTLPSSSGHYVSAGVADRPSGPVRRVQRWRAPHADGR